MSKRQDRNASSSSGNFSKRQDQNASSSSRNMSNHQDQNASLSSGEVDFVRLCEDIVQKMRKALKRGKVLNKRQCEDLATKLSVIIECIREHVVCWWRYEAVLAGHLAALYRYYEKAGVLVKQCAEQDWCAAVVFQAGNWSSFSYILDLIKSLATEIFECVKNGWRVYIVTENLNFVAEPLFAVSVGYDGDTNELRKRLEGLADERSTSSCIGCGFFLPDQAALKQQYLARYLLKKQKFQSDYNTSFTSEALTTILWEKDNEPEGTWGVPEFLGAGSGATGVLKTSWLGVPCAKKEFHGEASEAIFMKEAWIMARLGKHPCIIDFICCGNGKGRGDRFIAMELMEENLFDLIEERKGLHFSCDVALDIILQIADGVKFLHENGVAHRDLKPHNVVVNTLKSPYHEDYYCVKLVDFGTSKSEVEVSMSSTMTFRGVGTTRYRAPEAHPNAHLEGLGKVDWFKADVYSFAMTCAHILTLERPFENMETLSNLYTKLLEGERPILPSACSKELVDLVEKCWSTNRHERPKFYDIYTKLKVIASRTLQMSTFDMVFGKRYTRREVCTSTHASAYLSRSSSPNARPLSQGVCVHLTSNLIIDEPISHEDLLLRRYQRAEGGPLPYEDPLGSKFESAKSEPLPSENPPRSIYESANNEPLPYEDSLGSRYQSANNEPLPCEDPPRSICQSANNEPLPYEDPLGSRYESAKSESLPSKDPPRSICQSTNNEPLPCEDPLKSRYQSANNEPLPCEDPPRSRYQSANNEPLPCEDPPRSICQSASNEPLPCEDPLRSRYQSANNEPLPCEDPPGSRYQSANNEPLTCEDPLRSRYQSTNNEPLPCEDPSRSRYQGDIRKLLDIFGSGYESADNEPLHYEDPPRIRYKSTNNEPLPRRRFQSANNEPLPCEDPPRSRYQSANNEPLPCEDPPRSICQSASNEPLPCEDPLRSRYQSANNEPLPCEDPPGSRYQSANNEPLTCEDPPRSRYQSANNKYLPCEDPSRSRYQSHIKKLLDIFGSGYESDDSEPLPYEDPPRSTYKSTNNERCPRRRYQSANNEPLAREDPPGSRYQSATSEPLPCEDPLGSKYQSANNEPFPCEDPPRRRYQSANNEPLACEDPRGSKYQSATNEPLPCEEDADLLEIGLLMN